MKRASAKDEPARILPPSEPKDADGYLDEAIPLVRGMLLRQMKEHQKKSEGPTEAVKRSRESATSSNLVRTLERLDALARSREKRGKKAPTVDEKELRERFIRRMDQLLADEAKADAARKFDGR